MEDTKTLEDFEITKETQIGDILRYDINIGYLLMECGMHCVGCPSSLYESLEEACMVHGLDADDVLTVIKQYLAEKAVKDADAKTAEATETTESAKA